MLFKRYEKFRSLIRANFSEGSQRLVDDALIYADKYLEGQSRYDGSPMLDHAVGVAHIAVEEIGLGRNSSAASILHDVVRLAHRSGGEEFAKVQGYIREHFGEEALLIAMSLANISDIELKTDGEQAANFRDMIISYSSDPRVILIKLADRLEVMRNLSIFPEDKWAKKSWESINLYAQIAHKLGLYNIKSELEDVALSYLEHDAHAHIVAKLAESEAERKRFIAEFVKPITERMDRAGIKYHLKSRTKSVFSIWTKMRKQQVPFEGVYDIFAIRIIIDCEPEFDKQQCWLAYSIVSDCYTPNPKRMRDWVSIPKSNGYESLHATVSAAGKWVEVQIRTERMDAVAERGIAAHWRYKGVSGGAQTSEMWLSRLRELMEATTESIADRFDAQITSEEIFVFTPNGDIRKLPEGATLLDFAFDIHTNVGSTCMGGKINNRSASIREMLKNGDIVEVFTQKNQTPKADWLNVVVTSKARTKIKAFMREESAKNARIGREELERKIKNWKLNISMDDAVAYLCKHFKQRTGMELYELIATQKIDISSIKELLQRLISGEVDEERRAAAAAAEQERAKKLSAAQREENASSSDALVIDESINNLDYKLAKCCNPIKGDDIFGFVTVSTGVTIHRMDCPNAARLRETYPYRVLDATWRASASGAFRVTINIVVKDAPGLVNQITEVISKVLKLNMRSISLSSRADGTAVGTVSVEVPSVGTVDTLIHSILRVKGVLRAFRANK